MLQQRLNLFDKYDSESISILLFDEKRKARLKIMSKFVYNSWKQDFKNIRDIQDQHAVKNHISYLKYQCFKYLCLSAVLYRFFLCGIYNSGSFYFNMNSVPKIYRMGLLFVFSCRGIRAKYRGTLYDVTLWRIVYQNQTISS